MIRVIRVSRVNRAIRVIRARDPRTAVSRATCEDNEGEKDDWGD